jgi:hypothetical protein
MALTGKALEERVEQLYADELERPYGWYYLSFADPDLPQGEQFLGAAVVRAQGIITATSKCHDLQINPGGQVMCLPLPEGKAAFEKGRREPGFL